ncbi:hypothetical protein LZC95_09150 [Pendulispora brunnea]|uniref:Uncharacterized protein n=1 Tax=Pendulispora brunnea TaxID=2905690 RepID=A0ABZ2KEH8_9BACT
MKGLLRFELRAHALHSPGTETFLAVYGLGESEPESLNGNRPESFTKAGFTLVQELRRLLTERHLVRAGSSRTTIVRCTPHDRFLRRLAVPVAFFYSKPLDAPALIEGLARALGQVPIFAGRLRTTAGGLAIVCDDAGVAFSTADVNLTCSGAMAAAMQTDAPWLFEPLDAEEACAGRQPLLTIRLCRFTDGGAALGCSWHHAVGDMHTFMILMRAWSAAVAGMPMPEPLIVENRTSYLLEHLPEEGAVRLAFRMLEAHELSALERRAAEPEGDAMVHIHFSNTEIQRMREAFGAATGERISANDAICAHLTSVLRHWDEEPCERRVSITVNLRSRFGLDPALLGNVLTWMHLASPAGEEPPQLAGRIRNALARFAERHMDYRTSSRFLGDLSDARLAQCTFRAPGHFESTLLITNWSHFGMYDVAFGEQKPVFFAAAATGKPRPWNVVLVEGFGNTGLLCGGSFPAAWARRLTSRQGQALLHAFRDPREPSTA